jgi:hypothetical protein
VAGFSRDRLNLVYLTERGAPGKIVCSSFALADGTLTTKDLAKNDHEDNLFFPRRSTMAGKNKMLLLGAGNVDRNEFKVIEISFDEM